MKSLRIATRQSPLALWQARHVASRIREHSPDAEVVLVEMTTEGDRFLQAPLSAVGGKGLFVKEVEQAILDGRADLAVHSLKDMTSQMPLELCLSCVPKREDPRDAFVSPGRVLLEAVPKGARIGTASLRRTCQLRERRPDIDVVPLRGNVQTRLRKVEEQGLAGAVLAAAGLVRLGLEDRITERVPPEVLLPAVGQGVLAIQCRSSDGPLRELLGRFEDSSTRTAVTAERAFLAELEGGCSVPMAGFAVVEGGQVWLRGLLGTPDGAHVLRGERRGSPSEAQALGVDLAKELLARGGRQILAPAR